MRTPMGAMMTDARRTDSPEVPGRLVPVDRLSAGSSVTERDFVLVGNAINDRTMDLGWTDAAVRLGTDETWHTVQVSSDRPVRPSMRFTDYADADMPHMFHCHLVYHEDQGMMGQFVVLRDGQKAGRPPAGRHGDHRSHGGPGGVMTMGGDPDNVSVNVRCRPEWPCGESHAAPDVLATALLR